MRREGHEVNIDAVAGTDGKPGGATRQEKSGPRADILVTANMLICALSAAACLAVLVVGLRGGELPAGSISPTCLSYDDVEDVRLSHPAGIISPTCPSYDDVEDIRLSHGVGTVSSMKQ